MRRRQGDEDREKIIFLTVFNNILVQSGFSDMGCSRGLQIRHSKFPRLLIHNEMSE